MIRIVSMYAILASIPAVMKIALEYGEPLFFNAVRLFIGGFLLLSCCYIFEGRLLPEKKDRVLLAQFLLFYYFLSYIFEAFAVDHLAAGHVTIIYSLSPFLAAFFSYLVFSEQMTGKKIVGLAIGLLGFIPIAIANNHIEGSEPLVSWYGLILFVSMVVSTYGLILMRVLVNNRGYSPIYVNGFGALGASILVFIPSFLLEAWNPIPVTEVIPFFLPLAFVTLVNNVIAQNFFGALMKTYTATLLLFAGLVYPLFGKIFSWIFHEEPITWAFPVSLILLSIGLYIFYTEEKRQGYISS